MKWNFGDIYPQYARNKNILFNWYSYYQLIEAISIIAIS